MKIRVMRSQITQAPFTHINMRKYLHCMEILKHKKIYKHIKKIIFTRCLAHPVTCTYEINNSTNNIRREKFRYDMKHCNKV